MICSEFQRNDFIMNVFVFLLVYIWPLVSVIAFTSAQNGCPLEKPLRCFDLSCVSSLSDCPCPEEAPFNCGNGFCAVDVPDCHLACPLHHRCWNSKCVESLNNCSEIPLSFNEHSTSFEPIQQQNEDDVDIKNLNKLKDNDSCENDYNPSVCIPSEGYFNNHCSFYSENSWWLPDAYVYNAFCACSETPNCPTANCIRFCLQENCDAYFDSSFRSYASEQKSKQNIFAYDAFVLHYFTPVIYQMHVDAYKLCCCTSGPAFYDSWILVSTISLLNCTQIDRCIDLFGSCHGTPGKW